jgi:HEPN domain-containing protein
MVGKIFQDETDSLYRIFPYGYALQQLKDGNMFFVHGCDWSNLIYLNSKRDMDLFDQYKTDQRILNSIQFNFDKELKKIGGFIDGADFFFENGNISQSAFLFHQVMELLFRTVELFMMGKERKCHSIREHQNYIRTFVPELGGLFDVNIEEELFLLKLLDEAYLATRYCDSYPITKGELQKIREKVDGIYDIVAQLFEDRIKVCGKENDKQDTMETVNSKTDPIGPISEAAEKLGKIESMAESHFRLLEPHENRKGFYKLTLSTEGYLENSFMISNLLKVCILALYSDGSPEKSIPHPTHNVQEVLKCILELIPHEEMELLDELRNMLG